LALPLVRKFTRNLGQIDLAILEQLFEIPVRLQGYKMIAGGE